MAEYDKTKIDALLKEKRAEATFTLNAGHIGPQVGAFETVRAHKAAEAVLELCTEIELALDLVDTQGSASVQHFIETGRYFRLDGSDS